MELTQEVLKKYTNYDQITGIFSLKEKTSVMSINPDFAATNKELMKYG